MKLSVIEANKYVQGKCVSPSLLEQLFDYDMVEIPLSSKMNKIAHSMWVQNSVLSKVKYDSKAWKIDHEKLMLYLNTLPSRLWV